MSKPCDVVPMEFNVVVEMDAPVDRIGSILLPPAQVDKERLACDEGILVAVAPLAFTYDEWPAGSRKPEVGDRVLIARYSGLSRERDGTMWRIIKDKDVWAVIETQEEAAQAA